MLDEIESKTMQKVINRGKRSKTLSEVKAVENIKKNLQKSFFNINSEAMHMSTRILSD